MKTREVAVINGVKITAVDDHSTQLVPIRPICEALGVNYSSQYEKLKEHPLFASAILLSRTTGADGKQYEMACIPLSHLTGWLVTIHPGNVKEEVRPKLVEFQQRCIDVLYEHFFGGLRKENERNHEEIAKLELISELSVEYEDLGRRIKTAKKELEAIRKQRLEPMFEFGE